MVSVTLVYYGAGSLEALPYFFTQFLCNRTDFAELVVQLLKTVESTYHILFCSQLLCCFAECGLCLKILLEVIFASFEVQFQQVIELLQAQLVVVPQLCCVLWWYRLYLVPFILQGLHLLISLVNVFRGGKGLYALDDFLLALQISLFLLFALLEQLLSLILDECHLGLEFFLLRVLLQNVCSSIPAVVQIFFLGRFAFLVQQKVKCRLQMVQFCFGYFFFTVSQLFHAIEHLFLSSIDMLFLRVFHVILKLIMWIM